MYQSKQKAQEAFEAICLRQMQELEKRQKEDILDALEVYIYDALSECDYVKNNLLIDPPNIDKLYEHLCFAVISSKCAAQDLKKNFSA